MAGCCLNFVVFLQVRVCVDVVSIHWYRNVILSGCAKHQSPKSLSLTFFSQQELDLNSFHFFWCNTNKTG